MEPLVQRYGDGFLVFDPLYSYVKRVAELLETYGSLPISFQLKDVSLMALKDVFGDLTFDISHHVGMTISIAGVAWLLLKKLSGELYRGYRENYGPMTLDIAMFPDASTDSEDGMIGHVVNATATE